MYSRLGMGSGEALITRNLYYDVFVDCIYNTQGDIDIVSQGRKRLCWAFVLMAAHQHFESMVIF
jgi:hypothetical protein